MNGQEYPGLCLLSCICMKGIFHNQLGSSHHFIERKVPLASVERSFALLIFLSLSLEVRLTQAEYTESELNDLDRDIKIFLRFMWVTLGIYCELESSCGFRKVKFHSLIHFPRLIRNLGATSNFFGGSMEAMFKFFVKQIIGRTSRKHATYERELLERYSENLAAQLNNYFEKRFKEASTAFRHEQRAATAGADDSEDEDQQFTVASSRYFKSVSGSTKRYIPGGARFRWDMGADKRWSTYFNGKCVSANKPIHPEYNDKWPNFWVDMLCKRAQQKGYDRVYFLYHIQSPSAKEHCRQRHPALYGFRSRFAKQYGATVRRVSIGKSPVLLAKRGVMGQHYGNFPV